MRRLDAGTAGGPTAGKPVEWDRLGLPEPWADVLRHLSGSPTARPAQAEALGRRRVLDGRRNLILAAPTSAGKSLVGLAVLLDAIRRGGRAVLLEPLRAVAREQFDALAEALPRLTPFADRPPRPRLTTGDTRLDGEDLADPPPATGELVVATPERLEAVLRGPGGPAWLDTVRAVCVDEAHLIGCPRRGPTLEGLVTSLLTRPAPPRVVFLSASIGDHDAAARWLDPCDVVRVTGRTPPLLKEVWELDDADGAADAAVAEFARGALADPDARVLVFVYQTRAADRLAERLAAALGHLAGTEGPRAYHARMSAARRQEARTAFQAGECRCLVATTALAAGVNLPASHVLVRDTTFPGQGPLPAADLLQMLGRAGRGEKPGVGVALVRPRDGWAAEALAAALREEAAPPLRSALESDPGRRSRPDPEDFAPLVLGQLARRTEGASSAALAEFFARSLGGRPLAGLVPAALSWLCDPARVLAYRDESGLYRPTVLGDRAARSLLPLGFAAGVGQFLRDLLSVDPEDRYLADWQPLDHLVLLELLAERALAGRRFGERLASQVDGWVEAHPGASVLYREWLRGAVGESRAAALLGSLGFATGGSDADARARGYLAVFRAAVLWERGQGQTPDEVGRRWGLTAWDGAEERWRDDVLWLLGGWARLLEVRTVYHHLREVCGAGPERVRRVKHLFARLGGQVHELRDVVCYCSPLGPLLRGLRRAAGPGRPRAVGVGTIRRLEEAGVGTVAELARLGVDDLVRLGVRRPFAEQIRGYVRRLG